jgi:hypothetical protein
LIVITGLVPLLFGAFASGKGSSLKKDKVSNLRPSANQPRSPPTFAVPRAADPCR